MTSLSTPGDCARRSTSRFQSPPAVVNDDGRMRRVGFELEFAGMSLDEASDAVADSLDSAVIQESGAEHRVTDDYLGDFAIEIDWQFLKHQARSVAADEVSPSWASALRELAKGLVPVEVVCPPVRVDELDSLQPVVRALHDAGAEGTHSSPLASFGVHINAETPSMSSETLHRYLRAYCLLQWWLMREHEVVLTRRLGPFVHPYPEPYLHSIHALADPSNDDLLEHYLEHNATRNRALDMLPLFAEFDEETVQSAVADVRITPRPTFHYRLPNSDIDQDGWTLAESWNRWCVVEALANDPEAIEQLTADFQLGHRGLLGYDRKAWIERIDQWVRDLESA